MSVKLSPEEIIDEATERVRKELEKAVEEEETVEVTEVAGEEEKDASRK